MTPTDSRQLATFVNERNARLGARAEAAADFVLVLVIGIVAALALLHYLTPCAEGVLC